MGRSGKIQRAERFSPASVCPDCDVLLWDGVAYTHCPACSARVQVVDPTRPVWCCRTCRAMENARVVAPTCSKCERVMVSVFAGSPPGLVPVSLRRFLENVIATPQGLALVWVALLLCSHPFTETQCLSCKTPSPHSAWYTHSGSR